MRKIGIVLIGLLFGTLAGCRHAPDEDQVRKAISVAAEAAEDAKVGTIVGTVTEDFEGNAGQLTPSSLSGLLRIHALRGEKIHVLMGPVEVQRRGNRMVATFTATLTSGTGVLPDDAGAYEVETGWRKEGGEWRCFTATWKKAL